jgi:hypothetical protein
MIDWTIEDTLAATVASWVVVVRTGRPDAHTVAQPRAASTAVGASR